MMTLLHVLFGTVALVAVPFALVARKGGMWHRRLGSVFTVAMSVVLLTAGFLWQAKGHVFLVPLSAVTAYLLFSGWRTIARRRRRPDSIEDRIDMLAAAAAIFAGIAVAGLGVGAETPLLESIRPALVGIGVVAIAFALNDLLGFASGRMPAGWVLSHLSAMLAAYVSAVTAFVVINAHAVPMLLRWAVPSSVGAVTIIVFTLRILRTDRSGGYTAAAFNRSTIGPGRFVSAHPRLKKDSVKRHESSSSGV